MTIVLVVWLLLVVVFGVVHPVESQTEPDTRRPDVEKKTKLLFAAVIFRHGDRTPDYEEMDLYPTAADYNEILFPYGPTALTNKGKRRAYIIGMTIRKRYKDFISPLYLPDEVTVRSTDFKRTQMTALVVLAGLYPPPPAQKWNPAVDWQPIPYNTLPYNDDDLLYWYNCPRYLWLRDQVYEDPEIKQLLEPYKDLFNTVNEHTNNTYKNAQDIFYLDNLFQCLENVGQPTPSWVQQVYSRIKEVTKIEYKCEYYNPELIRLSAGVLMTQIRNVSMEFATGDPDIPKLWLLSAHENNVAALMAAARVFKPHQPKYCSTFALELRQDVNSGQYGIMAVYYPDAGGQPNYLEVEGCGGLFCDFKTFLALTEDHAWTNQEFREQCPKMY